MSDLMGKHCKECNGYIEPWSNEVLCFECRKKSIQATGKDKDK